MSHFQPLEVVGRGSKPQLQVGENLNKLTWLTQEDRQKICWYSGAEVKIRIVNYNDTELAYKCMFNCRDNNYVKQQCFLKMNRNIWLSRVIMVIQLES